MNDEPGPQSPIKIDIGAKLEIKAEVPSDASGRFVNAFTDTLSPLTEWLGLMGDKLRIHRRLVVLKLIKQAEERISLENAKPHPIPIKLVVPLLEQASQEEFDDHFMIGMWANLLASAATTDAVSPRYIGILRDLNGRQASLLQQIHEQTEGRIVSSFNRQRMVEHLAATFPIPLTSGYIGGLEEALVRHGFRFIAIHMIFSDPSKDLSHSPFFESEAPSTRMVDLQILESLGLLERDSSEIKSKVGNDIAVIDYCGLTPLAAALLKLVQPAS